MISEFMLSSTQKDLVIISNVEHNKFYDQLLMETGFDRDNRIKFVGTVYDQELLKKIREEAYGYIHGHEVGGTNPSLLEALASTKLNLLLDVGFNREVALKEAVYWTKEKGGLTSQINDLESYTEIHFDNKQRIIDFYNWKLIVDEYESIFEE